MKKIKLDLNKLKVDSFEVSKTNSKQGTVQGNFMTEFNCFKDTLEKINSCLLACDVSVVQDTRCC